MYSDIFYSWQRSDLFHGPKALRFRGQYPTLCKPFLLLPPLIPTDAAALVLNTDTYTCTHTVLEHSKYRHFADALTSAWDAVLSDICMISPGFPSVLYLNINVYEHTLLDNLHKVSTFQHLAIRSS